MWPLIGGLVGAVFYFTAGFGRILALENGLGGLPALLRGVVTVDLYTQPVWWLQSGRRMKKLQKENEGLQKQVVAKDKALKQASAVATASLGAAAAVAISRQQILEQSGITGFEWVLAEKAASAATTVRAQAGVASTKALALGAAAANSVVDAEAVLATTASSLQKVAASTVGGTTAAIGGTTAAASRKARSLGASAVSSVADAEAVLATKASSFQKAAASTIGGTTAAASRTASSIQKAAASSIRAQSAAVSRKALSIGSALHLKKAEEPPVDVGTTGAQIKAFLAGFVLIFCIALQRLQRKPSRANASNVAKVTEVNPVDMQTATSAPVAHSQEKVAEVTPASVQTATSAPIVHLQAKVEDKEPEKELENFDVFDGKVTPASMQTTQSTPVSTFATSKKVPVVTAPAPEQFQTAVSNKSISPRFPPSNMVPAPKVPALRFPAQVIGLAARQQSAPGALRTQSDGSQTAIDTEPGARQTPRQTAKPFSVGTATPKQTTPRQYQSLPTARSPMLTPKEHEAETPPVGQGQRMYAPVRHPVPRSAGGVDARADAPTTSPQVPGPVKPHSYSL